MKKKKRMFNQIIIKMDLKIINFSQKFKNQIWILLIKMKKKIRMKVFQMIRI